MSIDIDLCPKLHYFSGDVASAPLPPHLAPGARRCSAIALRLGGGIFILWAKIFDSFVANNENLHWCLSMLVHLAPGVRRCSAIALRLEG